MKDTAMNRSNRLIRRGCLVAGALLVAAFFSTCDLFKPGFGPRVDTRDPVLDSISSIETGSYVKGMITVSGTASDDSSIVGVTVTVAGISREASLSSGGSWSLDIDTGSLPDGETLLVATVTDGAGKTSERSILIYIDNTAPTVLVTYPLTFGNPAVIGTADAARPIVSNTLTIKGEAYDASPIQSVTVQAIKADGTPVWSSTQAASGTRVWTAIVDISATSANVIPASGTYRYYVTATDKAGNVNGHYFHRSDILAAKDAGQPFPLMDDLGKLDQGKTASCAGIDSAELATVRKGSGTTPAYADFWVETNPLIQFDFFNLDETGLPGVNLLPRDAKVVGVIKPRPGSSGAIETASVVAEMRTGGVDWDSASAFMTIPSTDSHVALTSLGESVSFTYELNQADFPDGLYWIHLRAQEDLDAVSSDDISYIPFTIDAGAPVLTEDNLDPIATDATYRSLPFKLAGTASASGGGSLTSLTISQKYGAQTLYTTVDTLLTPGATWISNINLPVDPDTGTPGVIESGSYSWKLVLLTSTGKTVTLYRTTTYDAAGPVITIDNPGVTQADSWMKGDTLAASGSVTDPGSQVSKIEYSLDNSVWKTAGGEWNATITKDLFEDNDGLGMAQYDAWGNRRYHEGMKTLYLRAYDSAGNMSSASRAFGLDLYSPVIVSVNPASLTSDVYAPFDFSAILHDSDGLASVTITQKKDAGSALPIPDAMTVSGTDSTVSPTSTVKFPRDPANLAVQGGGSGTYVYEIIVADVSGRTATATRTVVVDVSAPTVVITDPVASPMAAIMGSAYEIKGTAVDSGGSTTAASYWAVTDKGSNPTDPDVANASVWTLATGTDSWKATLDLDTDGAGVDTGISEGEKTLHVKAKDSAGNVTASAVKVDFLVDQANPVVTFIQPATSGIVYKGPVDIAGTAVDTNLDTVRYKVGSGGGLQAVTGGASWNATVPGSAFASDGEYQIYARATDKASKATEEFVTVKIDKSAPLISFTNIETAGNTETVNTVITSSTPRVSGVITDGSGILAATSVVDEYNYTTMSWGTKEGSTTLGSPGGLQSFTFSKDVSAFADGMYRITVSASDVAKAADGVTSDPNGASTSAIIFRIDRSGPALSISSPVANSYQSVSLSVSGTSGDNNTVSGVLLKIDSSDMSTAATAATLSSALATSVTWTASVSLTGILSGAHTLYAQATDATGATTLKSVIFYVDSKEPSSSFAYPVADSTVFGDLTIRGSSTDNIALSAVTLYLGLTNEAHAILPASIYSWNLAIDTAEYASATHSVLVDGVWNFTVRAHSVDVAGNVHDDSITFKIDNNLDKPRVSVAAPQNGKTVGGAILVTGSASDDTSVASVEMQVEFGGVSYSANTFDFWNGTALSPGSTGDGDVADLWENRTTWYPIAGTDSWSKAINSVGEMYMTYLKTKTGGIGNGSGATGMITVRVRAIDNNGTEGNPQSISINLNESVPGITITSHAEGELVKGSFGLHAVITDDVALDKLEISTDGGVTYADIISTAAGTSVYVVKTDGPDAEDTLDDDVWTLNGYPIHTEGTTRVWNIRLRTTEESLNKYSTTYALSLNADNSYPDNATTSIPSSLMGTACEVSGFAQDRGEPGGVSRVEGWISNAAGTTIHQLKGTTSTTTSTTPVSLAVGSGYSYPTAPSTTTVNYPPADDNYRFRVDNNIEAGSDLVANGGDGDGYVETFRLSGGVYTWSAIFNSNLLADGAYLLNYVIWDNAGNGTWYTRSVLVKNHVPVIDSITVATDMNLDGDVLDDGEHENYTAFGSATGFTVRNSRMDITVNASSGNGQKYYRITNAGNEFTSSPFTSNTLSQTVFALLPDSAATTFAVRVYDSTTGTTPGVDSLETTVNFIVAIDNDDTTLPTISLAPFGKVYSQNNSDALKTLTAVSDYDEDIVTADGTLTGTRLGHVEYAASSLIDGTDADISGKVRFHGKVWDDQRITKVTAQIDGFDPDGGGSIVSGGEFTIASWNSTGRVLEAAAASSSPYWVAIFEHNGTELSYANGHVLNWKFAFDSAAIQSVAANNVDVVFRVYDNGDAVTTGVPIPGTTVDVVPYITSVARTGHTLQRSRYGKYPVREGEAGIVLTGFNLMTGTVADTDNWVRVYNAALTAYSTPTVESVTPATATTAQTMTISVPTTTLSTSGWLEVARNSVRCGNNRNSNAAFLDLAVDDYYNREVSASDAVNTANWTDDRYLSVWDEGNAFRQAEDVDPSPDVNIQNYTTAITSPSMSMGKDGTLYGGWMEEGKNRAVKGDTTGDVAVLYSSLDNPKFCDLSYDLVTDNWSMAYLTNYYSGSSWGSMAVATANAPAGSSSAGAFSYYGVEWQGLNSGFQRLLEQFQEPHVVRYAASSGALPGAQNIHLVYFDKKTYALKYTVFNDASGGAIANNSNAGHKGYLVLDGGNDIDDTTTFSTTAGNAFYAGANSTVRATGTSAAVSPYSAIDVIPATAAAKQGYPVVLYYDQDNQTLKLARASSATPTNVTSNWAFQTIYPVNSQKGTHVQMKIDTAGNIHAVCQDGASNKLLYLHAPAVASGDYSFTTTVVDDVIPVYADIVLGDSNVPFVSYVDSNKMSTVNGLRVAWKEGSDWERLVVPASATVEEARTGIEVKKTISGTAWTGGWGDIAIGYLSDRFELVYRRNEAP